MWKGKYFLSLGLVYTQCWRLKGLYKRTLRCLFVYCFNIVLLRSWSYLLVITVWCELGLTQPWSGISDDDCSSLIDNLLRCNSSFFKCVVVINRGIIYTEWVTRRVEGTEWESLIRWWTMTGVFSFFLGLNLYEDLFCYICIFISFDSYFFFLFLFLFPN